MKINHRICSYILKYDFFENIFTFNELFDKIIKEGNTKKKLSEEYFSVLDKNFIKTNITKIENCISKRYNEFVGDIFEVFSYAFLSYYGPILKISDVTPSSYIFKNDYGVDAYGTDTVDFEKVSIQVKFRSNINSELTYKDLSTFGYESLIGSGEKDYQIKDNSHMIVITTSKGLNHHAMKQFSQEGKIRVIDYKVIKKFCDNDKGFWNFLKNSISSTIDTKNNKIDLYDYQQEIIEEVCSSIYPDNNFRKTFILPTGAGKSIIQTEFINQAISSGCEIILSVAPTIELVNQLGNVYENNILHDVNSFIVSCEGRKDENGIQKIDNSTSLIEIIEVIISSKVEEKPLIISSTYKSYNKVINAIKIMKMKIDLLCLDEAHHVIKTEFYDVLKKAINDNVLSNILSFTATPTFNTSEDTLVDVPTMNDSNIFGEHIVLPLHFLIKKGVLSKPKLTFVTYNTIANKKEKTIKDIISHRTEQINGLLPTTEIIDYSYDEIMSIIYSIQIHMSEIRKYKNDKLNGKIIIACASVSKSHLLAMILNDIISIIDNDYFDEEWYVDAISSNQSLTKMFSISKDRDKTFNNFKKPGNGILCHYNVLSEGIDIPDCTKVILLRGMNEKTIIQTNGRTLRRTKNDILFLKQIYDTIDSMKYINNPHCWEKPYGGIIIPIFGESDNIKNIVLDIMIKLLSEKIDYVFDSIEYKVAGEYNIESEFYRINQISLEKIVNDIKLQLSNDYIHEDIIFDEKDDIIIDLVDNHIKSNIDNKRLTAMIEII